LTYLNPLLSFFTVLCLAGLFRRPWRTRLIAAGAVGFILVTWPPLEWLASRPLESAYPVRPFRGPADFDAIVVFAENVEPPIYERPYPLAGKGTAERCEYAAWIYRTVKAAPVVACGSWVQPRFPPFAETMRDLLQRAGVPEDRIWLDIHSHDTHQNAAGAAAILRQHGMRRVVLVVDARSMPRASGCLRKEGIDVVPAPSHFRSWGPLREELFPDWRAIKGNDDTIHELLGLAWYRYHGWL
jgi:uncharacterized SAM-binding protein YcdF (DUF218 family)